MKLCMAQIEVMPGNPAANKMKMLDAINKAVSDGADIIAFPEMCIPGYLLGDMWERQAFLNECREVENTIVRESSRIPIVFGNVDFDPTRVNEDGRVRKYNNAVIASDGKVVDRRIKSLQPNYREFDDNRHFYDFRKILFDKITAGHAGLQPIGDWLSSKYLPSIIINGIKVGVMLCEDGWSDDYAFDPSTYLFPNCDMVLNISCSPYTHGKNDKRNRVFSSKAKAFRKPLVYVNCVGSQNNGKNIYTFDGNSCIYDYRGMQLNPFKPFQEAVETFEIGIHESFGDPSFEATDDIGTIYDSIVYATTKFVEAQKIERIVIGASGGIDSCVVACIMHEVVGPKNLLLVNMPSKYNSKMTKDAARQLAQNLDCNYVVTPIEDSVNLTKQQINPKNWEITNEEWTIQQWPSDEVLSTYILENVQARDRSSRILAAWASWFKAAFTCNANKSEATVGYTTLYGDLSGFIAPISDLWKGQVYQLARYINKRHNCILIPTASIDVVPSAELSEDQDITKGKGDPIIYPYHDKLFASWVENWNRSTPEECLKWYLEGTLEKNISYDGDVKKLFPTPKEFVADLERWWNAYCGLAIAKRIQAPPVICVSRRSLGWDHRESQVPVQYTEAYALMKDKYL